MKDYYLDQNKKPNNTRYTEEVPQCRPWVRFFSRMIDIYLFGIILGLIQIIFFPSRNFIEDRGLGLAGLILWGIIEAQLLSSWGTTPGKWLFKTKIRDYKLNKLSFPSAIKRSVLLFVIGLGFGVFSSITMFIAFINIDSKGATSWDKHCNSVVIHEKIGVLQIIIISIIIIISVALLILK
ncbi:RDD family protein [Acetivibrio cellulolyticus]|uniref:RDD family protein n=1 Tax=Acetivibrio cellulolyticus TaxID=35830 RepID=UPI0001E2EC3E|nr:RDD family protein [Acetivibrio cellulolyticus]